MHEYYRAATPKLRKTMGGYLKLVAAELEDDTKMPYDQLIEDIWSVYERDMLERFPYIGGDSASGTSNLTGAYMFVAMGEVLRGHGFSVEHVGRRMVQCYERYTAKMPGIVRKLAPKVMGCSGLMTRLLRKKDAKNAANCERNPGSFRTETQEPTAEYAVVYRNLSCPLSDFAKAYGYEEYMPYLCNLDYASFGGMGLVFRRTHTCFEDGDYCDFMMARKGGPLPAWPPVFTQGEGFK